MLCLAAVMASVSRLTLTRYGVLYYGRATRALIETIGQDTLAVHETTRTALGTTQALQETTPALQPTPRQLMRRPKPC